MYEVFADLHVHIGRSENGKPIKITADDGNEGIADYVEFLDQYNDQDDNNAELSKICSIFGYGYEMYYVWLIRHLDGNPWDKTRIYVPEYEWLANAD